MTEWMKRVELPENYVLQQAEILKLLIQHQVDNVLRVTYGHAPAPAFFLKNLDVTDVNAKACNGLPYSDQRFDVVYCFNVLEHLSEQEIGQALHEMQRVSKKHVLISVPFNEALNDSFFYCERCHASMMPKDDFTLHSLDAFLSLALTKPFRHVATFLPGDTVASPQKKFSKYCTARKHIAHYLEYACVQCGCNQLLSSGRFSSFSDTSHSDLWCCYNELLLLLTREGHTLDWPTEEAQIQYASLLDVNFSNAQQRVREGFVAGALWSRFELAMGVRADTLGVSLIDATQPNITPIRIQLPVTVRSGDRLQLTVSGMKHAYLSLFGVDGMTGRVIPLFEKMCVESKDKVLNIRILDTWRSNAFGAGFALYLYGNITIHQMRYKPRGRTSEDSAFLNVSPGLNFINSINEQEKFICSVYVTDTQGLFPIGEIKDELVLFNSHQKVKQMGISEEMDVTTIKISTFNNFSNRLRFGLNYVRVKLLQRLWCFLDVISEKIFKKMKQLFTSRLPVYPERWQLISNESIPSVREGSMNVLVFSHLFPHPAQPGLGSFVLEHVKALQQAGVNVRVVSGRPFWFSRRRNFLRLAYQCLDFFRLYHASSEQWWSLEGIPVKYLPYPLLYASTFMNGWGYHRAFAWHAKKLRRAFKFDFIHAHTGHLDGGAARLLASRSGCPYVITEHTGPFATLMQQRIVRRSTLKALRSAEYVTAVSKAQKEDILTHLGMKHQNKLYVVHNSVDLDSFCLSKGWSPDPMAPKILFVGYFVPVKNISLLLEAFQLVHAERPRATLMLVGGGENREQEEAIDLQLKQLEIEEAVEMRGYTARKDVASLMSNACDMLVLSSKSESFGCVVAEALAAGKPAVVTRCGGPEDIVTADWMGRICENNNPKALADAILSVANQLPLMDAQKIRASVASRFSSDVITKEHVRLYKALLK